MPESGKATKPAVQISQARRALRGEVVGIAVVVMVVSPEPR